MNNLAGLAGRVLSAAALFVPTHVRWKIVAPYIVLTLIVAAGRYVHRHAVRDRPLEQPAPAS